MIETFRCWLAAIAAGMITLFAAADSATALKFVALPDTQIYSQDRYPGHGGRAAITDPLGTFRYYMDQTQWIADHWEELGIDYVIHLGDIIQTDTNPDQWLRAKSAMSLLDEAGVPYGTVIGNHDAHNKNSGRPYYEKYVEDYGPDQFVGKPWYGGASATGVSNYQIVGDGDVEVLFLNLALAAPAEELAWANAVLRQHRDKLVVVTTHSYMWDLFAFFGRYGEDPGPLGSLAGDGLFDKIHDGVGKTAQQIYEEFIQSHPNIIMAQGGHFDADLYRLDGRNGSGLPVLEIVSDYQSLRNGGDGYLRIYEIDAPNNRLSVETYSPTLDRTRTTFEHFVNSVWLIYQFREDVADVINSTPEEAFVLLTGLFRVDVVPGEDIIGQHPEYLADPDYYDQLLSDQFRDAIPPELGDLSEWEALWLNFFAADPDDPSNYGDSVRSPSFTVDLEFQRYLTANRIVTTKQRKCTIHSAKLATRVAGSGGVLGKKNVQIERCIRDAGRARLGATTVNECMEADLAGVTKAEDRTVDFVQTKCASVEAQPEFGFAGTTSAIEAAKSASLGMAEDVFGNSPLAVADASTERSAYQCQLNASIQSNALFERILRYALTQANRLLQEGTTNSADLTTGMLSEVDTDVKDVILRARSRLQRQLDRRCVDSGVDVASLLPGHCAEVGDDAEALAACLELRARCRACETLNGVQGSSVSCDFFDDGVSANATCP